MVLLDYKSNKTNSLTIFQVSIVNDEWWMIKGKVSTMFFHIKDEYVGTEGIKHIEEYFKLYLQDKIDCKKLPFS